MGNMPIQKPGRSKQDYGTPPELLKAIRKRLNIENFALDVAASPENAVCDDYLTAEDDALSSVRDWRSNNDPQGWTWCNPPYADIEPWVKKAVIESALGANIAVLIPLSISEWWVKYVEKHAYKISLHGRIKFVGADQGYPKDCALLLYTPWRAVGSEVWDWKRDVPQLLKPEPSED